MSRHVRVGTNSLANALLGNTSTLAAQRGFRNEASGQANLSTALLNRSKTDQIRQFMKERGVGLDFFDANNPELGAGVRVSGDKTTPAGVGSLTENLNQRDFRNEAAVELRAGNKSLGANLSGLAADKPYREVISTPVGPASGATGELADPSLFVAKVNKEKALTQKAVAAGNKLDAEASKLGLELEQLKLTGGRVPPTGNGILNYSVAVKKLMADFLNPATQEPIAEFGNRLWHQLSEKEKDTHILAQIARLTQNPEAAKQVLKDMGLPEDTLQKIIDEKPKGFWADLADKITALFGTEENPKSVPPDPDAPSEQAPEGNPQQPVPTQEEVPGAGQFQEFREQQGLGAGLGPQPLPAPVPIEAPGIDPAAQVIAPRGVPAPIGQPPAGTPVTQPPPTQPPLGASLRQPRPTPPAPFEEFGDEFQKTIDDRGAGQGLFQEFGRQSNEFISDLLFNSPLSKRLFGGPDKQSPTSKPLDAGQLVRLKKASDAEVLSSYADIASRIQSGGANDTPEVRRALKILRDEIDLRKLDLSGRR